MIRKLRRKFVFVNMIFVCTILAITLALIIGSYLRRINQNIRFYMESELRRVQGQYNRDTRRISGQGDRKEPSGEAEKGKQEPAVPFPFGFDLFFGSVTGQHMSGGYMPSVACQLDEAGTILKTQDRDLTIDDAAAQALISKVFDSTEHWEKRNDGSLLTYGYDKEYSLRYLASQGKDGFRYIVFADISYEQADARSFILISLGVFTGAMLLFLLLSHYLAIWALAPAEKAWEQQNRFVADASHELKTPLTVILANLDILSSHPDSTIREQRQWIRNTREEAERMRDLIQDLLFLAKSDANALPVLTAEVDMTDCAEDRALNFEAVAFENDVTLDTEIENGLKVTGSESQLKQLLTILLDNAVKYTGPKGRVLMKVFRKQDKVIVSVNNTGEPISAEDLPHIFERFYRPDKSRARADGGCGLGLSIAENIVQQHNGTISCTSSREEGTTFRVELPAV